MDIFVYLDLDSATLKDALRFVALEIDPNKACGSVPLAFLYSSCHNDPQADYIKAAVRDAKKSPVNSIAAHLGFLNENGFRHDIDEQLLDTLIKDKSMYLIGDRCHSRNMINIAMK